MRTTRRASAEFKPIAPDFLCEAKRPLLAKAFVRPESLDLEANTHNFAPIRRQTVGHANIRQVSWVLDQCREVSFLL